MVTTPTLTDSATFDPDTADVPVLRIEEGNTGEFKTTSQTFSLTLSNGDWDDQATFETLMETYLGANDSEAATYTVDRVSDARIDITFLMTALTSTDEMVIKVPIAFDADEEGDVTVELNNRNTSLSGGTYTVARISGGDTTSWVDGTTTFSDEAVMEQIMIEENVLGTLDESDAVKLKFIDSDFTWYDTDSTFEIRGAGTFDSGAYTEVGSEAALTAGTYFIDDHILYILPDVATSPSDTGSIVITGAGVDPDDADFGVVKVKVYGEDVTEETLELGTYSDYDVTAEADEDDDMVTIYSGKIGDDVTTASGDWKDVWDDNNEYNGLETTDIASADADTEEAQELMTLVIDETVAKSWITERTTEIEFPEWVKIIDVKVEDDTSNVLESTVYNSINDGATGSFAEFDNKVTFSFDKVDNDDTTDVWLTFFVSVEADATGDIVATVGGSALEEDYEVKLGEAVAPVTVDIATEDVKMVFKIKQLEQLQLKKLRLKYFKTDVTSFLLLKTKSNLLLHQQLKLLKVI